jgi:hypothetical protein
MLVVPPPSHQYLIHWHTSQQQLPLLLLQALGCLQQ